MTLSDPEPQVRCNSRLWQDVDGVRCHREAGHRAGHVYLTGDGSACSDHHRDTEPNTDY